MAIDLATGLDAAFRDLRAIAGRLTTMHDEGYWPAAPDHDAPTRQRTVAGPDDVPGQLRDCGVGDERARVAWCAMSGHLYAAELAAADALAAIGGRPAPVPVPRPTSLLDAQTAVRRLSGRLRGLQRLWSAAPPPVARKLADALLGARGRHNGTCLWHICQAMYESTSTVAEVGNGQPPPPCTGCRRVGSVGQPRKGGLCHACYQRRWRRTAA